MNSENSEHSKPVPLDCALGARNQQLEVEIKNGRLEITIGVDLLCFAIEHGPIGEGLRITDNDVFAAEIRRTLLNEEEDGSTPVHRMFDVAADEACEQGAEGCELE